MTETKREFEKYVRDLCCYFRRILADEYQLNLRFDQDMRGDVLARIKIDTTYLYATIQISKRLYDFYKQGNFADIADALSHELSHILTEPLVDLASEDRAPSKIQQI